MFLFDDIIEKLKGSRKMRTMLLSFNPYWYEKIKSGEKVFEYRTNFPDDIVKAYMYVSSPYKKAIGIIYLGQKVNTRRKVEGVSYSKRSARSTGDKWCGLRHIGTHLSL